MPSYSFWHKYLPVTWFNTVHINHIHHDIEIWVKYIWLSEQESWIRNIQQHLLFWHCYKWNLPSFNLRYGKSGEPGLRRILEIVEDVNMKKKTLQKAFPWAKKWSLSKYRSKLPYNFNFVSRDTLFFSWKCNIAETSSTPRSDRGHKTCFSMYVGISIENINGHRKTP